MALTQEDLVAAVTKLNELTQLQVIRWRPCEPPEKISAADQFSPMFEPQFIPKHSYEVIHDQRRLRITQYEARSLNPLNPTPIRKYSLEVRDSDGSVAFEFPDLVPVVDLFRSVQTQRLDIEGFIKRLVAG